LSSFREPDDSTRVEMAAAMRKVGAEILRCREQGNMGGKFVGTQFKAAADLVADRCMRDELLRIEDIPIVSEEDISSQAANRPPRYWLIDPIDGTASFAQGFLGFVCQAALIIDRQPWAASVYAPALQRLYLAGRGKGATVNGQPISVKPFVRRHLTLVDNYPEPRGASKRLFHDLECTSYLESGSIGLKTCLVAEGAADIFVKDVCVRDWDVAAPHLVLHEAGGVLTQFTGEVFEYQGGYERAGLIAASSVELLREVSEIVARYGRESRRM
jgi:3'(2'), 5'-bisphosphate nucleotidase